MNYDFTSCIDRYGHDALAVEAVGHCAVMPMAPKDGYDLIPMWVADMNFPVPPSIPRALIERASHPLFGYFDPCSEYYKRIIQWQTTHNGVEGLHRKHIGYENGVLGGVVTAANVLCSKGDSILVHSPTYVGFTNTLENNGYRLIHSPLYQDEQGVWRMDFEDMEKKLIKHRIHTAIFCSPHNPTGRVWEREEIERAMEIFRRHQVYVISDEIWSDLIMPGHRHIPTQSVSEDAKMRTVAMYAPSKTFNLAGLIGSYRIVYNDWIRERMNKEGSLSHYNSMNVMSEHALIGAYNQEGEEWLKQLIDVLEGNLRYMSDFINRELPGLKAWMPQGTYMLFVDCSEWCAAHHTDVEEVLKRGWRVGVGWQDGRAFHGPSHIRINVALPFTRVQEACRRLKTVL